MFRLLRTAIGLAFIAALVWCSFHVPLGSRTFAEHVDRIGRTPAAQELLEGTRSTLNPALREATDRLLGEHIEAPTAPPVHASATPWRPRGLEPIPEDAGPPH